MGYTDLSDPNNRPWDGNCCIEGNCCLFLNGAADGSFGCCTNTQDCKTCADFPDDEACTTDDERVGFCMDTTPEPTAPHCTAHCTAHCAAHFDAHWTHCIRISH